MFILPIWICDYRDFLSWYCFLRRTRIVYLRFFRLPASQRSFQISCTWSKHAPIILFQIKKKIVCSNLRIIVDDAEML